MTPNGTRIRHRVRHARLAGVAFVCAALLVPAAGADAAKCTKKGGKGVDVLKGTKKKDVLCGKGGDDVLIGKGGNDVLKGAAGADTLTGKSGNDKLAGGAGDDTLAAGAGNDSFNGGPGIDVAALADSKSAVTVDLGAGTASGDGQDTVAAVENVIGSPVADTLIGDAAANELSAGDGDDTVQGAGGDDVLEGQGGTDSTSYAAAGGPVAADLRAGTVTGEGSDAISGIENLTGSPHADTIIGDDAANVLDGGPGSDTASFAGAPAGVEADLGFQSASGDGQDTLLGFEHLSGSAHGDKLIGDGAANTLAGGEGNDTLTGLGGNDALQGGGGSDNAAYGSAPGPINADLRASSVTGEGNDALGSVEGIIGSPHGDTLAGDANSNRLDGAGGTDTVSFAASPALVDAGLGTGVVTGDGADTLLSVENAIGSSHDDSIAGTAGDNAIAGGPGNDTIAGEAGDDQISGENGNDRLFGAEEDDSIFGGAGDDLLDGGGGANECDGGTGVNTFAGNCDGTAPALTAFAISPTSIDTAAQSRTVGFTLTLTDDAAGVDPAASRVIVHGPSGDPTFSGGVELVSGNDLNGDYTAAIQLPRFSAQGMWTVEVQLADQSGNSVTITTAQLATAGRPNSFQQTGAGDDSGPVLTALSRNPTSIDTNAAPVDVRLRFHDHRRSRRGRSRGLASDRPRPGRPADLRGAASARRRRQLHRHRDDPALLGSGQLDDRAVARRHGGERELPRHADAERERLYRRLHPDRRRRHGGAAADRLRPVPGADQHRRGRPERQLHAHGHRQPLGGRPGGLAGARLRPGQPAARREPAEPHRRQRLRRRDHDPAGLGHRHLADRGRAGRCGRQPRGGHDRRARSRRIPVDVPERGSVRHLRRRLD